VRRIAAGPLVPTPGAQCRGHYRYEYAIFPHAGDWKAVYQAAHNYNAPLLGRRADTHPGLDLREMNITRDDPALVTALPSPRGGPLPDALGIVEIDLPELVLSAVRRSDRDSLIVRFYNISRETVVGTVRFGLPVQAVYRAAMSDERHEPLPLSGQQVRVTVRGGEVVTLEVIPDHEQHEDGRWA
jgi:alpha-mannosidase